MMPMVATYNTSEGRSSVAGAGCWEWDAGWEYSCSSKKDGYDDSKPDIILDRGTRGGLLFTAPRATCLFRGSEMK